MPKNTSILSSTIGSQTDLMRRCHQPIDYQLSSVAIDKIRSNCIVVTISKDSALSPHAALVDKYTGGLIREMKKNNLLNADFGNIQLIPVQEGIYANGVLIVGIGASCDQTDRKYSELISLIYQYLHINHHVEAALFLSDLKISNRDSYWHLRQQIVAMEQAAYRYKIDGAAEAVTKLKKLVLVGGSERDLDAVADGLAIAQAINTARMLGDMPPNQCTPSFLADFSSVLDSHFDNLTVEIMDEQEMEELGMGAILSVGQGSAQPSKLITLNHQGAGKDKKPIILVGKGITFDTGGTAIKSRDGMRLMKYDMCGAATIIGVLEAVSILNLPINVIGIAACAENMPGSKATRPSDVIVSHSGKSIEILNPDAEGRLVLCDALSYVEKFDPEWVIDVATLTGASVHALGHHYSALFSDDLELKQSLFAAADYSMDDVWQLPLSSQDLSQLDSNIADISNMGNGTAGCVIAAVFLSQFTTAYPWAHLDISGTAKLGSRPASATGRPAHLLMQLLLSHACGDRRFERELG